MYRPAVDIARLLSAALVVCFHAPAAPYKSITLAGLAYFIVLMFCLQAIGSANGRPFSARKRAARLLLPWLVWSAFYLCLKLVNRRAGPGDLLHSPASVLVGPELHLWFLPFAFVGTVLAELLLRAVSGRSGTRALVVLYAAAAVLAVCCAQWEAVAIVPFKQWLYALPLLPIGLAVGLAQGLPGRALVGHALAANAVALWAAWVCDQPSYLLATLALVVTVVPRTREYVGLKWAAGLSLGIYLLHPFAFTVLYKTRLAAPWPLFVGLACLASMAATALIARHPVLNRLAFGTESPAPRPVGGVRTA